MDQGVQVVIGMLVSYLFAFLGLAFAWISYNRRKKEAAKGPGREAS